MYLIDCSSTSMSYLNHDHCSVCLYNHSPMAATLGPITAPHHETTIHVCCSSVGSTVWLLPLIATYILLKLTTCHTQGLQGKNRQKYPMLLLVYCHHHDARTHKKPRAACSAYARCHKVDKLISRIHNCNSTSTKTAAGQNVQGAAPSHSSKQAVHGATGLAAVVHESSLALP